MLFIFLLGGLLIMMGQHSRSESLFYYFRLEDQIPESHLLRMIDRHINFDFVREKLKDSYSETGRPSIDPELLLRILLPIRKVVGDVPILTSHLENADPTRRVARTPSVRELTCRSLLITRIIPINPSGRRIVR
jgi:hypothetical protein